MSNSIHSRNKEQYSEELTNFRAEKDKVFKHNPQSPLTREQRATFTGIAYYPPAQDYIFDLAVTPPSDASVFAMDTSTGSTQRYRRWGKIQFSVEGQTAELTIYISFDGSDLFLPFRDATSGHETYGAGRYLDITMPEDGERVHIDFNQAYNPYCAYNENWSCPVPPAENWLTVPIHAGEKVFAGH